MSTELRYGLDFREIPRGELDRIIGHYEDDFDLIITGKDLAFTLRGSLHRHGPALRDVLEGAIKSLDHCFVLAQWDAMPEARAKDIEFNCARLAATVEGQVEHELDRDRGMEARVL
jgi:hypothetical protein